MNRTIKALGLCVALAAGLGMSLPSYAATTLRIGTVLAPDDPMISRACAGPVRGRG